MQTIIGSHPIEDVLERYALGHLSAESMQSLEEHLFVCERCQSRLEEAEEHLRIGRAAAKEIRAKSSVRNHVAFNLGWLWTLPKPVWAGVLTGIVLCVATPFLWQSRVSGVTAATVLSLEATRGSAQAQIPQVQTGNLTLKISTAELPQMAVYALQLVDSAGREIWSGTGSNVHQQLLVSVPGKLAAGQYWVRLSSPQSSLPIREFGVLVH